MGLRVLVCGGREFDDINYIFKILDALEISHIISGGASGADSHAYGYALIRQITITVYPARWAKYGKKAGPLRNIEMATESKADLVVAFPGGKGTDHMVDTAKKFNIKVMDLRNGP